jgi:hypothetical protein
VGGLDRDQGGRQFEPGELRVQVLADDVEIRRTTM